MGLRARSVMVAPVETGQAARMAEAVGAAAFTVVAAVPVVTNTVKAQIQRRAVAAGAGRAASRRAC